MNNLAQVTMSKIQRRADKDLCNASSILSPHLENAGTKVRKTLKPDAELLDIQRIQPETTDYLKSKVITFVIQTGSYAVRFLKDPLQFKLKPTTPNTQFSNNAEEEDSRKKYPRNGCTPFAATEAEEPWGTRAPLFNPIVGAPATLICETETYLDNQLVQASRDNFISMYTALNHLFLPAAKRQEVVGHPYILHSSKNTQPLDRFVDETSISRIYDPSYWYTLNSVNCEKPDEKDACVILRGSLAGIFPFCPPKNLTLNQILRCEPGLNQMPMLPPHCELTFRMRLQDPLHVRCIDNKEVAGQYFSSSTNPTGVVPGGTKFAMDGYELQIKDISLYIQKIKWQNEQIHKQLSSGTISWNFEEYQYRATALGAGQVKTITKDFLPPNTGLVYMLIGKSNQFYKDGTKLRSSDCTRFAIPENLNHILIRLNNKTILFENGLEIPRSTCHQKEDAALFYAYLRDRELTTDSFDTWFPNSDYIGYKNAFPLDLTQYGLKQPAQLNIEISWTGGSPEDHFLMLVIPHSVSISRDTPSSVIWKSTAQLS